YRPPEIGFIRRKPRRRCTAQYGLACAPHRIVLDRWVEVAINLLETHSVEDLFVLFRLLFGPLAFRPRPEPIEDEDIFRNEPFNLFARHATRDFILPTIGRSFFAKTLAADALHQHVAPHGHANVLLAEIRADARDVLAIAFTGVAVPAYRTESYGGEQFVMPHVQHLWLEQVKVFVVDLEE